MYVCIYLSPSYAFGSSYNLSNLFLSFLCILPKTTALVALPLRMFVFRKVSCEMPNTCLVKCLNKLFDLAFVVGIPCSEMHD